MKILVIKLSAIGDVVQTLPAIEAIKKKYPESEITWLVEEAASGIINDSPLIKEVLISRRKLWLGMLKNYRTFVPAIREIIRFCRRLRSESYDIAIDFQGLFKSGILIGLTRARRKIGFNATRELSYLFLNERLPAYDIEKHALERYLDIARYLGAENPSTTCTLPIGPELAGVSARMATVRMDGRPVVAINPVARWKTKLWPEERFAELADRLVGEKGAVIIFTGSSEDRRMTERICAMMKHGASNWAGETTLKELGAIAKLADVFVTTDTGPMHLAAAAGVAVVALFGPTAPWRTGPYGPSGTAIRSGVECSPCFKRDCDRKIICMQGISVNNVMVPIESALGRKRKI